MCASTRVCVYVCVITLMHADMRSARLLLCFSCRYFLADLLDLIETKRISADIIAHHVVV